MREILAGELDRAMRRRGLRTKSWAVEWDDSAIEFLLASGFTADLGARPLKRAIDRYLLSPLAVAIVGREVPAGDQFLYLSSNGSEIVVEFVDPDEPEPALVEAEEIGEEEDIGLGRLMLKAEGSAVEANLLRSACAALEDRISGGSWEEAKSRVLGQTESPGFWESPGRFSVLGTVEYMERIESGLATASSLVDRLFDSESEGSYSRALVSRLALQIYLLHEACAALDESLPRDAFLRIETKEGEPEKARFAGMLRDMYVGWARQRHMRLRILADEAASRGRSGRCVLAVRGFGAHGILAGEHGLHVLEVPEKDRSFRRHAVAVTIASQPDAPALGSESELDQAQRAFQEAAAGRRVVRSYREEPSALVRDNVRGWRTGRLDVVLAGNFDLFARTLRAGAAREG
jgi:ATP-dependent Clp protease ATP-binding subunit ClpC